MSTHLVPTRRALSDLNLAHAHEVRQLQQDAQNEGELSTDERQFRQFFREHMRPDASGLTRWFRSWMDAK